MLTFALSFIKSSCVLFFIRVFNKGINVLIEGSLTFSLVVTVPWGINFALVHAFMGRTEFGLLCGPALSGALRLKGVQISISRPGSFSFSR